MVELEEKGETEVLQNLKDLGKSDIAKLIASGIRFTKTPKRKPIRGSKIHRDWWQNRQEEALAKKRHNKMNYPDQKTTLLTPSFEKKIEVAREGIKKYQNALIELAR